LKNASTHKAEIPFKEDEEPSADALLWQFFFLTENIYKEMATRNAIEKL